MKKRVCAVILSMFLAVNLVGVPKAKAVVSETALLGSIFGSLLVSMGYSWAADNMDVPGFGQAIYDLIQEHDEVNKDTGLQLIRDLNLAGGLSQILCKHRNAVQIEQNIFKAEVAQAAAALFSK